MAKVIIKRPGQDLEVVDFKGVYRGDCTRLVGDDIYPEYVPGGNNITMIVDENGLIKKLPQNFLLQFPSNPFHPIQQIVGNVVFCRTKPANPWVEELWDYELADVTEEDIRMIRNLLSEEVQRAIGRIYGMV